MMNPEYKALWISKLREEGRWQGTGCLRSEDGEQCCLDVVTEIAVENGVMQPPVLELDGVKLDYYNYYWFSGEEETDDWAYHDEARQFNMHEYEIIPGPAMEFLGFTEGNPKVFISQETLDKLEDGFMHSPGEKDFVTLNDEWHLDFHEIAIVIEDSDL